jgi:hypothetical protein
MTAFQQVTQVLVQLFVTVTGISLDLQAILYIWVGFGPVKKRSFRVVNIPFAESRTLDFVENIIGREK